jgi:hypothetical protein
LPKHVSGVRQTHVPKNSWACSNLHLHELQTKWVVRFQAPGEEVDVRGILLAEKWLTTNLRQQVNFKFGVKFGKVLVKWWPMVNMLWKNWVFWMAMAVKEGWEGVQDEPRSGQSEKHRRGTNADRVWTAMHSDQRSGVRLIAEEGYRNLFGRRDRTLAWQWILHHNNACVHDALRVHNFLPKNFIAKLDHPTYSPDLAPCNSWLFPEGRKIFWHSWHPVHCDNITVGYYGKWYSRLVLAVAPSTHEVHCFTMRVFRRWQQLLMYR